MDPDIIDDDSPKITESTINSRQFASQGPPHQGFRFSRLNIFSRKPKLKPEVIELGPISDADDPSTSSHVNQSHARISSQTNADNLNDGATDDENSGVFDTHIAVLYDRYVNFKESLSNKIRDKIMKFMRDDLENEPPDEDVDVEGGLAPLQTDSTYDRLVFILTILLGFIFRSPIMWIVGSFLFLIYGNFKKKIVKWGVINIVLAVVSIIYGAQSWSFPDPDFFTIKPGSRSILMSRIKNFKIEPGVLTFDGKDAVILTIEGNKNLKWSLVHNNIEHKLSHGNFSNELLIDSKLIPKNTNMIRLNHEIMVKGLVQVSVKFKTDNPTPAQSFELPKSHYYPLHHSPSNKPYEVSFECYAVEPGSHETDHSAGTYYHIDFGEGVDSGDSQHKNLKGVQGGKFQVFAPNHDQDGDSEQVEDENEKNLPVKAFEDEKDDDDEAPIKVDSDKISDQKKYIGVDATESDVFVTRLFQVSMLSKCSLIHIPRSGTDVVSVFIKRLQ